MLCSYPLKSSYLIWRTFFQATLHSKEVPSLGESEICHHTPQPAQGQDGKLGNVLLQHDSPKADVLYRTSRVDVWSAASQTYGAAEKVRGQVRPQAEKLCIHLLRVRKKSRNRILEDTYKSPFSLKWFTKSKRSKLWITILLQVMDLSNVF